MLTADPASESPMELHIKLTEPGQDIELKAMAFVWSILCELNQVQRDRAIAWIAARNDAARLVRQFIDERPNAP